MAIAVLAGLTLFIARQDERAAQESAKNPTQLNNGAVSESNEQHPQKHIENTNWDTPGWYSFFRWPTGTTTWAIILTLLAIAEQTAETAKAAKATRDSVGQGIIWYTYDIGITRNMSFMRKHDPQARSFVPTRNPDTEYTD